MEETIGISLSRNVISLCLVLRLIQDPLAHHGRHFGCVVHAFCSIQTLLTNGILRMGEEPDMELLSAVCVCIRLVPRHLYLPLHYREHKELEVFHELLGMDPGLEEWLMESSEDKVILIADLVSQLSPLSS